MVVIAQSLRFSEYGLPRVNFLAFLARTLDRWWPVPPSGIPITSLSASQDPGCHFERTRVNIRTLGFSGGKAGKEMARENF